MSFNTLLMIIIPIKYTTNSMHQIILIFNNMNNEQKKNNMVKINGQYNKSRYHMLI